MGHKRDLSNAEKMWASYKTLPTYSNPHWSRTQTMTVFSADCSKIFELNLKVKAQTVNAGLYILQLIFILQLIWLQ